MAPLTPPTWLVDAAIVAEHEDRLHRLRNSVCLPPDPELEAIYETIIRAYSES